jgi:hypothetical protein
MVKLPGFYSGKHVATTQTGWPEPGREKVEGIHTRRVEYRQECFEFTLQFWSECYNLEFNGLMSQAANCASWNSGSALETTARQCFLPRAIEIRTHVSVLTRQCNVSRV